MKKPISPEIAKAIATDYLNRELVKFICRKYECSPYYVHYCCFKNGVSKHPVGSGSRRYSLNESYFSVIDTEEKAYWLGLLASDGSVDVDSNGVELGLSGTSDKYLLERFLVALGSNASVKRHKTKYPNAQPAFRANVCSGKLKADLVRLGIVPQKSLILRFPTSDQVPAHLLRHFVRGYFDGDGSVSYKRDGSFLTGVTSSPLFISELSLHIKKELELKPHIERKTSSRAHNLKLGGNFVSFIFLDWIYRDAKIYMNRKQSKYQLCKQMIEHKLKNKHHFYNIYRHPAAMAMAKRCAVILGISFEMDDYNGLSIDTEEQGQLIKLYQQNNGIRRISQLTGHSKSLIVNTLRRNNVRIRSHGEAVAGGRRYKSLGLNKKGIELMNQTYAPAVDILLKDLKGV